VPVTVNRTIPRLFRHTVEKVPDKTWLLGSGGGRFTYGQALEQVERAATALRSAGIGPGHRVLVTARTTPEYLWTWLALMEVGAIQVAVNPSSSPDELAGFLTQVAPSLVVTDAQATRLEDKGRTPTVAAVDVGQLFEAPADTQGPADIDPDDIAVMIPTSGTTGRSKLVMQTHRAYVMAGEGFPFWMGLTAADRLMTSLPLFHINAPAYSVLGSVAAGASLVLLESFSAAGFIDASRRFDATEFNAIGAMLEILMRQPERPDDADNPLRICYSGPSPPRRRHLEIEERFGLELVCGYALSETPYALIWRHGTRPFGSLGAVRQHPELGHVNDARVRENGRDVVTGAVGELELRNPAIMRGYYDMPEETAAVLVDGWLRTGDLVRVNDDDTYTFVGRRKQVIRRRGENLSPLEVEEVLQSHGTVAEAAVIGVPSDLSDEDIKAFVVPVPGTTVDLRALHAYALTRLARFKVPRYLEVVDDLPHTPTGRLASHQLPHERTPKELDMETTGHSTPTPGDAASAPPAPDDDAWLSTWIGGSTADRITVAGRDLAGDIMGRLSLTELAYLLITHREPTAGQRRLLDAVLVSLADHGLTPSALAARLTYTGAPEAVQGAVAAGLLGAGSVFLGPAGDTAQFLADALGAATGGAPSALDHLDDTTLGRVATEAVSLCRDAGRRVPGLGHPVHRQEDPRTPRLYALARQEGLLGAHMRLLEKVAVANAELSGRRLPVNGAGAAGAALTDMGVPPTSVRGFVLIARTAGLVAHLAEEAEHPIGMRLWHEVESRAAADPAPSPPS
jgi:crotonobetaine/carnitine-CoA ligase